MADELEDVDDLEVVPTGESKSSRVWLSMIAHAEKAFSTYQDKANSIDRLFADLHKLSNDVRDREFQLFWSNIQVLGPSIYARPPVPVVVPKFKDRRPLYRVASELLERSSIVAFDLADINSVMLQLRDDLAIQARGAAWVRYQTEGESSTESERICIDHKDRKDFLHEPARKWADVGWVAGAAYLTRREMRKRFRKSSGDAYQNAEYEVQRDEKNRGEVDHRYKCKVWEIWSKTENKVVWVTKGVDVVLEEGKPHLKLEGFFPCPKPAYGTLQRRSLIPVPDVLQYKDQLEEINTLTARIHALSASIKVRGFYPGGGEMGDAIEAAIKLNDDRKIMVPIANWAVFKEGNGTIVWLPIDMIAETLKGLVELRRQLIDDVYQIMGLSDIMRGSTDPNETAAAQNIKAQYGSVRVRDKQNELVRIARDLVRICAEIMAENFDEETLLDMSQMEIPSDADIRKRIGEVTSQAEKQFEQQISQALSNPQMAQQAQANPQAAEQQAEMLRSKIIGQGEEQIRKLKDTPTLEKVMKFLRDQKTRPFVLDIETDSTIQPDEQAEKQSRMEFMNVLGKTIQQFAPVIQMSPAMAPVFGELVKFAMAPYRVGRQLEGVIDDAIEQAVKQAQQPKPNPEEEKIKGEQALQRQQHDLEMQKFQAEQESRQADEQRKDQAELLRRQLDQQDRQAQRDLKAEEHQARMAEITAQGERDARKSERELMKLDREIKRIDAQTAAQAQSAVIKTDQSERAFEQKSALAAQRAILPAQPA